MQYINLPYYKNMHLYHDLYLLEYIIASLWTNAFGYLCQTLPLATVFKISSRVSSGIRPKYTKNHNNFK